MSESTQDDLPEWVLKEEGGKVAQGTGKVKIRFKVAQWQGDQAHAKATAPDRPMPPEAAAHVHITESEAWVTP